ncbi:hypothetical protein E8E13_010891 [Curvularia kusanoi]|uniref:Uncharacterized protein n=1 Tax=Curvularia kusanoi TaxID=90978 RepID=A0A9P4WAN5_CURKU|nr:hypothetical protein E8E13_010891 [Curvularia kusanoi]
MKVTEQGTDRTADAHIRVGGKIPVLREYGQYIDTRDGAICCYVPVDEEDEIMFDITFHGTTLTVAYDAFVDGFHRKSELNIAKSVKVQKKKLTLDTFLCKTSKGIIDTKMTVTSYTGRLIIDKDSRETIGTLELRIYITRQFDVEHEIDAMPKYDKAHVGTTVSTPTALYKDVPPQFNMQFEENSPTLEATKVTRENSKMNKKRPGTGPWATFRFHYRTERSITERKMPLTFAPNDKVLIKAEPHTLELDPIPQLQLGSKPANKNDGEISTRASSPAPSETSPTPMKSSKKPQTKQPKVVKKEQSTKLSPKKPPPTKPDSDKASTNKTDVFKTTPSAPKHDKSSSDRPAEQVGEAGEPLVTPTKAITGRKANGSAAVDPNTDAKGNRNASDNENTTLLGLTSMPLAVHDTPIVPQPIEEPGAIDTTTASSPAPQAQHLPHNKDVVKSSSKGFASPLRKPMVKPLAPDTTGSKASSETAMPSVPTTPVKRDPPEGTLTPPLDSKRIKIDVPLLTPGGLTRPASASPSPRTMSIEVQLAEKRKQLETTRKVRAEIARKRAEMDERLAPHKQHMAKELERLNQEMADEEAMMAEEEEDYKASQMLLAEFEGDDSGS